MDENTFLMEENPFSNKAKVLRITKIKDKEVWKINTGIDNMGFDLSKHDVQELIKYLLDQVWYK